MLRHCSRGGKAKSEEGNWSCSGVAGPAMRPGGGVLRLLGSKTPLGVTEEQRMKWDKTCLKRGWLVGSCG